MGTHRHTHTHTHTHQSRVREKERRRIFTTLFIIIIKKKKNRSIIPYYIHTHTHTHTRRRRPFVEYIYIYIYISLYIYLLIGTTILYSNIIKKEKQTNKEHTIILSRRSTLSSVHFIPSEQLLGIYLLFGTKKKAGEEYDMTTGTRKNKPMIFI